MKTITLNISEDFEEVVERYTLWQEEAETAGRHTHQTREEARSYACEALAQLLRDNPQVFRYAGALRKITDEQRERAGFPQVNQSGE